MQETGSDLIFQKYKKVSTQLLNAQEGFSRVLQSSALL